MQVEIVRERFPAHAASHAAELEDAPLAAGDFDWLLRGLEAADAPRRRAYSEGRFVLATVLTAGRKCVSQSRPEQRTDSGSECHRQRAPECDAHRGAEDGGAPGARCQ